MKGLTIYTSFSCFFRTSISVILFFILTLFVACKDLVDIDPPRTEIAREDVFSSDELATSAISGLYIDIFDNGSVITSTLHKENGLYTDELLDFTGNSEFFENSILPVNSFVEETWTRLYQFIYSANLIIEGINSESSQVSDDLKMHIEGEAKFIRAWCHFHLVNLWGDAPLVTSTDFRGNASIGRTSSQNIYNQIVDDLASAQLLLSEDYSFSDGERGRVNSAAATALLARVYLYQKDWANAEFQASGVINNSLYNLDDLNEVFLVNSRESIWQIRPLMNNGTNAFDAVIYVLDAVPDVVSLNEDSYNMFDINDARRNNWIGTFTDGVETWFYPFKYKVVPTNTQPNPPITESLTIFRLAEQYLIRAEARAQLSNVAGAQEDLNIIRSRANLPNTTANNQALLLEAIQEERRFELFTEGSHRFFDLKRTGQIDAILSAIKPNWETVDQLYPLPQSDFDKNPNLRPQNPGYN